MLAKMLAKQPWWSIANIGEPVSAVEVTTGEDSPRFFFSVMRDRRVCSLVTLLLLVIAGLAAGLLLAFAGGDSGSSSASAENENILPDTSLVNESGPMNPVSDSPAMVPASPSSSFQPSSIASVPTPTVDTTKFPTKDPGLPL